MVGEDAWYVFVHAGSHVYIAVMPLVLAALIRLRTIPTFHALHLTALKGTI